MGNEKMPYRATVRAESGAVESPRSFVVVTTQRTGSSWLMGRIDTVPGAQGHLELFYNDIRREPARAGRDDYPRFFEIGKEFGKRTRMGSVFAYLDKFYSRPTPVGFKVMYSQLTEYPEVLLYVALRRLPVIHLVRNSDLDVVLSGELANATSTFHATSEESQGENKPLHLDPDSIVARVKRSEKKRRIMRNVLRILPTRVHEVSYEELNSDKDAFHRVCNFIGVDAHGEDSSKQRLVKRQRLSREKAIQNYEEVSSALIKAGYRHLL